VSLYYCVKRGDQAKYASFITACKEAVRLSVSLYYCVKRDGQAKYVSLLLREKRRSG